MKEIEEWYNRGKKAAQGESQCQCTPENWEISQKKRLVLRMQPVQKEHWPCAYVMSWGNCIKMSTLSLCIPWRVSLPMNHGDWPWSRCCSMAKVSPIDKQLMPFGSV